ncbi:MAG: prefoldin subunit beta [Desulfurococcales archaeon]|jgi:prefoldin beta subunit|nr:prefoldin subunit beta [Desulfurococcales archaeon]MCC6061505.1 prefoldin subunit beta [Desulfurococcales archaeon]NAZ13121.1 prefoldin subunit beta [Desulfurococcales archaeon]
MAETIPPELQQYVVKLQQLRNKLNQIVAEKSLVQAQLREAEKALEILKNISSDKPVYRAAGHLLVRVSKEDAEKDLSDKKDLLELRLKSLERQEAALTSEIKSLESKINEILGRYYGTSLKRGGG